MAQIHLQTSIFLVLVLLTSGAFAGTCKCHPPAYPGSSTSGCDVKTPVVPVTIKELLGDSCHRYSYPQVVVNAKIATFNDKATCIKYCLSSSEGGSYDAKFVQSSKLVRNGEYEEVRCHVDMLSPGVLQFSCPDIHTVYYEHIHYFDGPVLVSTTCLYVNETFIDQMTVYMSTQRSCDDEVIKEKFCDLGITVNSVEVLKQSYCEN